MGMFDSLYDASGVEWQTKAFACVLDRYQIGDAILDGPSCTYQVKVLGGPVPSRAIDSFATVRDGVLTAVPDDRIPSLPLLDCFGGWLAAANGA